VLLAVISGCNTASDSETGRELWNSQNNCAAFYRINANYSSKTGNRSPYWVLNISSQQPAWKPPE